MDIPDSYNTNNIGLIKAVKEHNAKIWVGKSTLFNLYEFATLDYGDLSNVVQEVYKQFKSLQITEITQTNSKIEVQICEKLVNIWALQQDLLKGNKLNNFVVVHFNINDGMPFCDIHPGRTRMFFKETYKEPVNVLAIDYANLDYIDGFEEFTEEISKNYKDQEYRLKHNWGMPFDSNLKHLLVQPNKNEKWHWPSLTESITFKMNYNGKVVTSITANNKPFIKFTGKGWIVEL